MEIRLKRRLHWSMHSQIRRKIVVALAEVGLMEGEICRCRLQGRLRWPSIHSAFIYMTYNKTINAWLLILN
jgi:hypothetical protein